MVKNNKIIKDQINAVGLDLLTCFFVPSIIGAYIYIKVDCISLVRRIDGHRSHFPIWKTSDTHPVDPVAKVFLKSRDYLSGSIRFVVSFCVI